MFSFGLSLFCLLHLAWLGYNLGELVVALNNRVEGSSLPSSAIDNSTFRVELFLPRLRLESGLDVG